jgi:hypothetical protein
MQGLLSPNRTDVSFVQTLPLDLALRVTRPRLLQQAAVTTLDLSRISSIAEERQDVTERLQYLLTQQRRSVPA